MKRLPDLSRIAKRLERRKATLQEAVRLYQVVVRLPALIDALQRYNGERRDQLEAAYIAPLQVWRALFSLC